jgi:deazaflavin-dependent oxidoreductase (nitroreductase family)
MAAPHAAPIPTPRPKRPLFGLRHRPGRLALAIMRMPLRAYRHGAGWLLGRTFLQLTHVGRHTGIPHRAVAMVLYDDRATGEVVICAAWGTDTDWYRNLQAGPALQVDIGRTSFTPQHRFLDDEDAFEVGTRFRAVHPWRLRLLSAVLGWGDLRNDTQLREFVASRPFVALRPAALAH